MGKIPDEVIIEKYGSIEAYKEYLHKKLSGKHFYTNGIEDKKFADNEDIPEGWYRGRTNSGKGTKGYFFINNGIEQTQIPKGSDIPDGWVKGALSFTQKHKDNLSKSLKGKKRTEEQCQRIKEAHNTKEYKEKITNTMLDKYGVTNAFQIPEVKEKANRHSKTPEAESKRKQTCKSNFGVDYPMQSDIVKEKSKQTCLENYGVEYSLQSEEIREKSKQTSLDRYGVKYPSQSEEIKQKICDTSMNKYGTSNPAQSEEVKNKMRNTNICKRSVPYPLNDPEVLNKQIITNKERNGVMYNVQLPQAQIGTRNSKPNREFAKLLDDNNIKYTKEFPLGKYSYDFKVDNILVEINPFATHNTLWSPFGDKKGIEFDYHYNKSNFGVDNGYRVIHIFDWDNPNKIIDMLKSNEIIYGRNTTICELNQQETKDFLNKYHLQNSCRGQTIRLGLKYNDEIISIMTFGKPRYNKNYEWELLRYCSIKQVVGGAEKLFKHFINNYAPKSIISYCDRSKFNGDVYDKLGFSLISTSQPTKHWYNPKEELSHITDNLLRQRGYDQIFNENYGKGTSNEELIIKKGYVPIYDCGQYTFGLNVSEGKL